MPSQNDDAHRPARQRANTSAFTFSGWRRGRTENIPTPTPAAVSPPLQWEALIEALTPPAVPSLNYARSLATALSSVGAHSPPPRLAILQPILATLCSPDSPPPLQTAGYDILSAFLEKNGHSMVSTSDRLSCLSLFVDAPWSQELWESRSKALNALIGLDFQTLGMEAHLLRMLESWIERAFDGLALTRIDNSAREDRLERQRSVESLIALLIKLVSQPDFVSRLTEDDTAGVLDLWERLLDKALLMPPEFALSPPGSPVIEPQTSKAASPPKLSPAHRRHHSSTSLPKLSPLKHPAEIIVDAYLTYLSERLVALAPSYLTSILPLLFRALSFHSTPLPRISIEHSTPRLHSLEHRISQILEKLVTGPYAAQCRILLKQYFFPDPQADLERTKQATLGALRTFRMALRGLLEGRLARGYIARASSVEYSPAGVPTHLTIERELMERAWAQDERAAWDLVRFTNVLSRATRAWIEVEQEDSPLEVSSAKEAILQEIAAIVKDVVQAIDQRGEGEEVDDEEVEAVGRITRELVVYIRSLKYVSSAVLVDGITVDCPLKDP